MSTSFPDDGGREGLETLDWCFVLTQLVTREDVIAFSHCESFKSYIVRLVLKQINLFPNACNFNVCAVLAQTVQKDSTMKCVSIEF
jgi:hypothetical protein